MLQIISRFFKTMTKMPVESVEPSLDALLNSVRIEMEKPAIDDAPVKNKCGRPRKYVFHDLEVGEMCRAPHKATRAVYAWGYKTGRKYEMKARRNGLWIKRVA